MKQSLTDLAIGEQGRVTSFSSGSRSLRRQLLAMGLTPGAHVEFVRVAPLGDPMEVKVRGFNLSLRRSEAQLVEVEVQA